MQAKEMSGDICWNSKGVHGDSKVCSKRKKFTSGKPLYCILNNMDPPAVLVSREAVRAMEAGLGCVSDATCSARQ